MQRIVLGVCACFMRPTRLLRSAIIVKPSTILGFHRTLVKRKYRLLFTPMRRGRPGPKGPSPELIRAILEMKRRNPQFGCPRIAQQLSYIFGIEIDKDVVRRVLAKHYRPGPRSSGPSWLTFLGNTKDSLWSVDLFRCESLILKSYWVMVVMDQFTRRIVGFAVRAGDLNGPAVCRMFSDVIASKDALPYHLSTDHDPLFRFHRWRANLRILDVAEVKTPYVPLSHPFVERLIGTIRREFLDLVPFRTTHDLEQKLASFMDYYNRKRVHRALDGSLPYTASSPKLICLNEYRWQPCCRGLYQLPAAA